MYYVDFTDREAKWDRDRKTKWDRIGTTSSLSWCWTRLRFRTIVRHSCARNWLSWILFYSFVAYPYGTWSTIRLVFGSMHGCSSDYLVKKSGACDHEVHHRLPLRPVLVARTPEPEQPTCPCIKKKKTYKHGHLWLWECEWADHWEPDWFSVSGGPSSFSEKISFPEFRL